MDLGITGKRALIVGGSSGLGFAVAQALAAEGVQPILFARDRAKLDKAADRLRQKFSTQISIFAGDMLRRESVIELARYLRDSGGLDILVVNMARPPVPMRDFLDETDEARWEEAYRTQLHSAVTVLRELTPLLVEKGWGRVVAITSASVMQPMPHHALSTIFRAGLTAALKLLANETVGKGVTVNAVCPASVLTEGFAANFDSEARKKRVPMGRLGKPEELAGTVAFLASQQAGFTTGANLQVDGGMVLSLL